MPRRVFAAAVTATGLVVRRLQGRPLLWLRRNTLRPKRSRDPVERSLAPLFRVLAREVSIEDVPALVDVRVDHRG